MYAIRFTAKPKQSFQLLVRQLEEKISKSRFTCTLILTIGISKSRLSSTGFYYGCIEISTVKLKEKKQYCGNHSGSCPLGEARHNKKHNYLEGADWIEFNDLINDFLDRKKLSAVVQSNDVRIRLNSMRRVFYGGTRGVWDKYGNNDDYTCGFSKKIESDFEHGTPGIYKKHYSEVG